MMIEKKMVVMRCRRGDDEDYSHRLCATIAGGQDTIGDHRVCNWIYISPLVACRLLFLSN